MQISGHKNVNSLNNYSKLNPEQSKTISDILTRKPQAQAVNVIPPAPPCIVSQNTQPNAQSESFVQNATPVNVFPFQNSVMPMNQFPMFMGSTFNGPVNFHFESKSSRSVTHTQTAVCKQDKSRSCSSSPEPRRWKRIKYMSDSSE